MLLTKRLELITRSALWAIRPEAIGPLVFKLTEGRVMTVEEVTAAMLAVKPVMMGKSGNQTAVIPVLGVLTKDGPAWYGSNYDTIANAVEQAGTDPNVKRVVLSVDSPGGEVTGLPETAALIAQVAKVKPVSAIVEGQSASAAYWLTTQARDVSVTPSGEVGSVGVRLMHVDMSKMLEDAGYKVTELHSGEFKTEWSPFQPLSDAAKEDMQCRLDATHADFINAVACGRGARATADISTRRFGEGRMFSSGDALTHGMVDKIQTPRDFMRSALAVEEAPPSFPVRARARVELERGRL